jgi:protein-disulfide isomerase
MSESITAGPTSVRTTSRLWSHISTVVTAVAFVGCFVLMWFTFKESATSDRNASVVDVSAAEPPVETAGLPRKGSATATLALLDYSDFECPFCGTMARTTMQQFEHTYVESGRVIWIFHHRPLIRAHPSALRAAESALCAQQQNQFWSMHDILFNHQTDLEDSSLRQYAATIGVDPVTFDRCLGAASTEAEVRRQGSAPETASMAGTPTILLGPILADGRVQVAELINGLVGAKQLDAELERLLGRH